MPSWLSELTQPERLLTTAFVLFVLWLIGKSLFKAFPFVASFVGLVQTLVGDKDNPGIGDRMDSQGESIGEMSKMLGELGGQVKKIHHEVTPNHGGSIKDEIGRVETTVNALARKLDQHITISKDKDLEQEQTAERVDRLAAKWAPAPPTE